LVDDANPLDLRPDEIAVLRELNAGNPGPRPDDPVWDALEQLGLVEFREKASRRLLTQAGRDYPTV
jgi:hypothetical protein